jgi:hypothetical protein
MYNAHGYVRTNQPALGQAGLDKAGVYSHGRICAWTPAERQSGWEGFAFSRARNFCSPLVTCKGKFNMIQSAVSSQQWQVKV